MKIASYNLHKCRGITGPHAPERNLAVIRAMAPDIIALQEVDFRYGTRPEALPRKLIADTTGLVPAIFAGTGEGSLGWHGQTILMRPELACDAVVRRLPLPGLEPRGAISVRVAGLTIVAVHLGLVRSSRRAQLTRIVSQTARIADGPMILVGDFNEWRDDRGMEALAGFRVVIPGRTYPAPIPRLRLDRMALDRRIHLHRSGVFDGEVARGASDHLPIWAEIALP